MNTWTTKKPTFKKECLFVTASKIGSEWTYDVYRIQKVYFDEKWYFGWLNGNGDEYGDPQDLKADKYLILPLLTNKKL